jgi:CheY-like chemotaxis protein
VRRKIRALLEREPDFEVLGECGSGAETVRLIRSLGPDLVFLDVEMPELDGLSVLQTLGPRPFAVIFVTAYEQYAVRAFEVKALDYLLKPFDRRRFRTALERAREHLRSTEAPLSRLLVRAKDRSEVLKVEDSVSSSWVEAACSSSFGCSSYSCGCVRVAAASAAVNRRALSIDSLSKNSRQHGTPGRVGRAYGWYSQVKLKYVRKIPVFGVRKTRRIS